MQITPFHCDPPGARAVRRRVRQRRQDALGFLLEFRCGRDAEILASRASSGFEVEDVRTGDDGTACITYRVLNEQNGHSRVRAVVQGDKVLRETTGNTRFAKAWNSKCVASR